MMSQPPTAFPAPPPHHLQQQQQQHPHPASLPPTAGFPLQQHQQLQQQQQQHPAAFFANNHVAPPYSQPQPHPQSRPLPQAHQQHQQQQHQHHHQQQPAFPQDPDSTMQWNGAMMMGAGGIPQAANYNSSHPHSNYPPQSLPPSSLAASSPAQNSISPSNPGFPASTAAFGRPQQAMTAATTAAQSTPPHPIRTSSHPQMQVPAQANTPSTPQGAQSPQVAREKARVTVLLDINSALLQEVVQLQTAGKAGLTSNQPTSQQASPTQETSTDSPQSNADNTAETPKSAQPGAAGKPSPEYVDCMRRLQANLAYLATVADRAKKAGAPTPQAPAMMTPPPHLSSINELYTKLNELFPGAAKGAAPMTPQQQQQQQQQQGQQQPQQQPGQQSQSKQQTPQAGDNSAGSTPKTEIAG